MTGNYNPDRDMNLRDLIVETHTKVSRLTEDVREVKGDIKLMNDWKDEVGIKVDRLEQSAKFKRKMSWIISVPIVGLIAERIFHHFNNGGL